MSTQLENPSFDPTHFQYHLSQTYRAIIKRFRGIAHSFVSFNLIFLTLFASELLFFFLLLPFLSRSAIFAFAVGILFLTGFSYFVLLFYLAAKKPEQLLQLKADFIDSCKQHLSIPVGEAQHHLSVADALSKLSIYLQDFETNFYKLPNFLSFLDPLLKKFSSYCYRGDVFNFKQLLVQAAIFEHIEQVRLTPTDLEVHASLANTYVAFSKLYKQELQSASSRDKPSLEQKFKTAVRLAIEEFRILNHFAPNDPWVHEQLAVGYGDLDLPQEEIGELEALCKLRPQNKEILHRLGSLYFGQGQNAKGLQIYEELKQANFKKAEELIASYGKTRN
jgi:hypothetical protein